MDFKLEKQPIDGRGLFNWWLKLGEIESLYLFVQKSPRVFYLVKFDGRKVPKD